MHKVYLDTCIVSGIAKNDLAIDEQSSVVKLLNLFQKSKIALVTAATTIDEINDIPDSFRQLHVTTYELLLEIPVCPQKRVMDMIGNGFISFPREEPVLTTLRRFIPDELDRQHLLNAISDKCDYFVTTDEKTILRYKEQLHEAFSEVTFLKPSEVLNKIICT